MLQLIRTKRLKKKQITLRIRQEKVIEKKKTSFKNLHFIDKQ